LLIILPKHPLTALAHVLLAHLAIRAGDIASAAQSIQICLGIWSGEARWHNLSARIYLANLQQKYGVGETGGEEDLNHAISHLEEAVRLEPTRASHAILLSQMIFQTAAHDPIAQKRALRILEKTSRITGSEPEIWLALAAAYQQLGGKTNLKLAYASAERAVSVAREANGRQALIEAHIQLGQMALSNAEPEEAYRQARQALRIEAYHPEATLLQVQALEALNRVDDALEVIEKALPNLPDNLQLQVKRGSLLSQSSEPAAGLAMLENLVGQYPTQPAIHSALAKNLYRVGRKEDAIQHAQQALQQSNNNETPLDGHEIGEMHTLLGNLYNELGHLDQAIYQFNTALQQEPEHIDAYLALAETYHKQRQFLKAQEVLEQAINAAPSDPRSYFKAGMAYKDGRNYEASANMLRKAAQLSPHDINIRKQLAAVMAIVVLNNTRNLGNKVADEVR
jgi:tetratricopeptide (TPR) repeat protein